MGMIDHLRAKMQYESDGQRLVHVGADGAMLRVFGPRLGRALKRAAQRVDRGDRDAIDGGQ